MHGSGCRPAGCWLLQPRHQLLQGVATRSCRPTRRQRSRLGQRQQAAPLRWGRRGGCRRCLLAQTGSQGAPKCASQQAAQQRLYSRGAERAGRCRLQRCNRGLQQLVAVLLSPHRQPRWWREARWLRCKAYWLLLRLLLLLLLRLPLLLPLLREQAAQRLL